MLQSDNPVEIQKRLPFLAGFIVLLLVVLLLRLWYLQAVKGVFYQEQAENNRIRPVKLRPPRGIIYDRYGRPMVESVLTFDISLVPEDASDLDATIDRLSSLIKVSPEAISQALRDAAPVRTKYEPVKIVEEAPWEQIAVIEAHEAELPGILVEPEHRRHYPYGGLASHQLGYIGKVTPAQRKQMQADMGLLIGQAGLEKIYDKYLGGVAGKRMIQVNASGRKVKDLGIEEPRPGTDIYLTLDLDVQTAAEEGLGDRAGAVVAIDPNSGEILGLVSHPNFDPNLFPRGIAPKDWVRLMNDAWHPLYNRAIQSVYPPGSTFKIVAALAGVDLGLIKPQDSVTCRGSLSTGKHSFRCWKKEGHGVISFHRALVESCDVYFYIMGERIGWDRISEYARKLGFARHTGILLPDEKAGLIPTTEWKKKRTGVAWYPGDTYINTIGQGFVQVSPIQQSLMMGAIANGGQFYRPTLLKMTRNRETGQVKTFPPERIFETTFNPIALDLVRKALLGVTADPGGTGAASRTPLTQVAGKTGTAQVVSQKVAGMKLSGKLADHGWYVAYAPFDDPKIALAILVEHGGGGGKAAAPIAKKIIEAFMTNQESMKNAGPQTIR